jgi:hypothetical protein
MVLAKSGNAHNTFHSRKQIPPDSRKSYNEAKYVASTWEVSTEVNRDRPVVAERDVCGDPKQQQDSPGGF